MLATSGTTVSYVAEEYFETPKKVNEVLMKVFAKKTAEEANKLIIEKYNLTEEQSSNITKYTHPQVDYEIVLVITSSMLRMKSAINYFAHYDFETGKTTQNELAINSVYLTSSNISSSITTFLSLRLNQILGQR